VSQPRVSVLVRSMDRPTLARTLQSIVSQTWPDIEIVVLAACGARHRRLPAVLGGRPLRFVVPDVPADRARAANLALENATGEFCNFLDDDDEFLPTHAARLAGLLRQPGSVVAYARQHVVDDTGAIVGTFGETWSRAALFERPCFGMAAGMFRRDLLQRGCRFDERLRIGEDHDFWIQASAFGSFVSTSEITSRWHAFIGDSGGGAGGNSDDRAKRAASAWLKRKWRGARRAYLASPKGQLERVQFALAELPVPRALRLAERAAARWPDDVNALSFAALANHYAGQRERALVLIERALSFAPGHAGLLANRELLRSAAG
jgi:glycosyltransferase involved in cell wall biosynthesis